MSRPMTGLLAALGLLLALPIGAQWPGEIHGRVVDARTGDPVPQALVEIPAQDRRTVTDPSGTFRLRGLEAGAADLRVSRIGYRPGSVAVEITHGRAVRTTVRLDPAPVAVEGVTAHGVRETGGATRVERAAIERSGARTAGDVIARLPGVALRQTVPGGAATVSVRGGGADAVLVLVDGVEVNDPVTGEADLGSIPAGQVESVTLLRGARSARYGPRASTGVLLIETRAPGGRIGLAAGVGTLGERRAAVDVGARAGRGSVGVGVEGRAMEGRFEHARLPGADERLVQRENADLAEGALRLAADVPLLGGCLRARGGGERVARGLPGLGHTPSRHARHRMERVRGSLGWQRDGGGSLTRIGLSALGQSARFADPDPPFGHPYDSHVEVGTLHLRGERGHAGRGGDWGWGVEGTAQAVESTGLSDDAPPRRDFFGAFLHGRRSWMGSAVDLEVAGEARLDRDAPASSWIPTHALTLSGSRGAFRGHVARRSAFTPPSLGDLFFREGVATRPNPDLRPERVPAEWEAGIAVAFRDRLELDAGAEIYLADIRDMVVWAPDFRFVWSPRNRDVRRRGVDLWMEMSPTELPVRLRGHHTHARTTYTHRGMEAVQLVYRPRNLSQLILDWSGGPTRAEVAVRRTGARNTSPSTINQLPAFWTVDLALGREWQVGAWALSADARVERALDERTPFIHDFPDPGRRLRIEGRLAREQPASRFNP